MLALDFDNRRTRAGGSVTIGDREAAEDRSPMALLMELYRLTHDREMDDAARAFAEKTMGGMEGFEA